MLRLRPSLSWRVLIGALFALGLIRCSTFAESPGPTGGADASSDDVASGDGAAAVSDAGADVPSEAAVYVRTGVMCGSARARCAVGESCCGTGQGEPRCAADCADAGATFYVFECGQASDCEQGRECCGNQNGTALCDGRLAGSSCVPTGNCMVCVETDGGYSARLCDPSTNADCRGKKCTLHFDQSSYTGCSL